jgi:dUTP pyrophosphatase
MNLKVKKLHRDAVLPKYNHDGDAGIDLFAFTETKLNSGERTSVPTGIAVEIPYGYVGLIWDKSGVAHKGGIKTLGGVIDSGYRGEIKVGVINLSKETYTFEKGHKIAQMLIQKVETVEIEEVEELSETVRGEKGFGSTGK